MDLQLFDTPRYLAVQPLFEALGPEALRRLAEGCQLRRLGRGEAVIRCGEAAESFHIVVTGQVKLHAISQAGQEKVIELVGPGLSFGESLLFSQRPSGINATALADTLLLSVGKAAVLDEIARAPGFALRLLAGVSQRMHDLMDDVEAYTLHSGTQRVVNYLLRTQSRHDGEAAARVSLPVSKATIASRLSITPEYFSRVLGELEAGEMIRVDKRDIRILNPQRLARYTVQ